MSLKNECDTAERISADLKKLGLKQGSSILVHASFKSLGLVQGGSETVIQGFLTALGEEGTLLMPALSFSNPGNPYFDYAKTPSKVGALSEVFRTRPGTRRSLHPTHSVCALGAQAKEFLKDHWQDNTPGGEHSPFRYLRDKGGSVMFLGCSSVSNTSMHAVEELTMPPYLFGDAICYDVVREDGSQTQINCRQHNFRGSKLKQRYDRMEVLLDDESLKIGNVLEAKTVIMDAKAMWKTGEEKLKENPYYFVEAREE